MAEPKSAAELLAGTANATEQMAAAAPEALAELAKTQEEFVLFALGKGGETGWAPHLAVATVDTPGAKPGLWLFAIAGDFNDHDVKHGTMRRIGREVYAKKVIPIAACLSAEAWSSRQAADAPEHVMPRDDPDRQEIIVVIGTTLGNKATHNAFMPVSRDGENHIIPSGEWERLDTTQPGCAVRSALLDAFWTGFFEAPAQKLRALLKAMDDKQGAKE